MKKVLFLALIILRVGLPIPYSGQETLLLESRTLKTELFKTTLSETRIPILMYHYVRNVDPNQDSLGWRLSISPEKFEQQLAYLKQENYKTIHLSDLHRGYVPEKSIILTFDDGLIDFYTTAFPLLQKYGFTASAAIIENNIGHPQHMNLNQLKDIHSAGIEIISHTLTHPDLSKLSYENADKEIRESKKIADLFQTQSFVYPAGKYNHQTIKILQGNEYSIALTTQPGIANLKTNNYLELPRVRIDNRDSMDDFKRKII